MTIPRRRIIRPTVNSALLDHHLQSRIQKQRHRLDAERDALARWMVKLRRAFHSVRRETHEICHAPWPRIPLESILGVLFLPVSAV
jgi:hypothetical protein